MGRTDRTPLQVAIFASGLSQRAIAKKAAIEESKFSKIVNCWREPSPEEQKRIARVFRTAAADLFPGAFDESSVA